MPVAYEVNGRVLVVRMVADYEPADIRATIAAALMDRMIEPIDGLVFDVRSSTALRRRTGTDVRAMAAFLAHVASDRTLRVALVADSDLAYGLMRVGAVDLASAGVTTMVFRDAAAAMTWAAGSAASG